MWNTYHSITFHKISNNLKLRLLSTASDCELLQDGTYYSPGSSDDSHKLNDASADRMPDWQSCKAHCENITLATVFRWHGNTNITDYQKCSCRSSYTDTRQKEQDIGTVSGKLHCENTGNSTE